MTRTHRSWTVLRSLALVSLLQLLAVTSARAGRSAESFPLESSTVSRSDEGNGKKSIQATAAVQLVNLTALPQNVTVSLLDESISVRTYVRNITTAISNWIIALPGNPDSWMSLSEDADPKQRTVKVRLGANESASPTFLIHCGLELNGLDCRYANFGKVCLPNGFNYQDPPQGSTSCPVTTLANQECATGVAYRARLKVDVEQDRGVIMTNFRILTGICNGGDAIPEKINYALNGGRPF